MPFWRRSRTCPQCQREFSDENAFPRQAEKCRECADYSLTFPPAAQKALSDFVATASEPLPSIQPPIIPDHEGDRVYLGGNPALLRHLYLDTATRNRHLYLLGKTRTGKTTLLQSLAVQDFYLGHGVGYIDPHGDAIDELLTHIPEHRLEDVIYFDPTSSTCPAFNLLALPFPPHKLAADVLSAFKMFFGDSWGPQLEMILSNSLTTLLADSEPHSLADLRRLLVAADYRDAITHRTPSDLLRDFWAREFPALAKTAVNPVLNKLNAFLTPLSPLERIFSQRENALDFSAVMNGRKILLVKLAKGELGEGPAQFLGGLIVTAVSQAALARATQRERPDFFLFVDEFQNYTVASFETILTEAAKYRLNLTLANQNLTQLPSSLRSSILGNVGTLVVFQCSSDDAGVMAREMRGSLFNLTPQKNPYAQKIHELTSLVLDRAGVRAHRNLFLLSGAEDRAYTVPEAAALLRTQMLEYARGFLRHARTYPDGITRLTAGCDNNLKVLLAYLETLPNDATAGLQAYFDVEPVPFPDPPHLTNQRPGNAVVRLLDNDHVFPLLCRSPLAGGDTSIREAILSRSTASAASAATEKASSPVPRATPPPAPKGEDDFTF
jgi:hypothetical protein